MLMNSTESWKQAEKWNENKEASCGGIRREGMPGKPEFQGDFFPQRGHQGLWHKCRV